MLATELSQIMSDEQFNKIISENDEVMICCGRNGPMCLPVYDAMESIQDKYKSVAFHAMPFDHPVAHNIRKLPEVRGFMGLPFTVYFKKGEVVKATSSIQSKKQVTSILDTVLLG